MEVREIDIAGVKLGLGDILDKIEKFQKEKYPKELILKKIVILQNLENFGNVWNITFFTQSFNTLNIKIRSDNGEIIEDTLIPLFGLDSSEK